MLRRRILVLSILLLSIFVLALGRRAWASPGTVLDVEAAVSIAMDNNPQISIAEERVEQAKARFRGAAASKAPTLTASALYQETWLEPRYPVYTGGIPTDSYALAGYRETWKTALTLSWLLYSSGSVENGMRSASLALEAVRAESVRVSQAVDHGARSAYFELQRARARRSVAEEALSLAREHQRQVEVLFRNGVVAKNELLRVKVAVSEAELNLIRASNGTNVAFSALERAVGTSIKGRYDLPDPAMDPGSIEIPEDPSGTALANRPELVALDFSRRSARALAAAAAAGGKGPSLYLQGEAFSAGPEFYPDAVDDWKITAVIEWKLYDGGSSAAKRDEALAAARELLYRVEDMKRQVILEVSSSMLDLMSAMQRLDVAGGQVALAKEDYRMATARYVAQVGTNIDVLDARVALSSSRIQLVDAVYDALRADSDVRFAIGTDHIIP